MTDHNYFGFNWRFLAAVATALAAGCNPCNLRPWHSLAPCETPPCAITVNDSGCAVAGALSGGQALAEAEALDRDESDRSVDLYYCACLRAAQSLVPSSAVTCDGAWQTYHAALERLISAGQRYGRLDPRGQLVVQDGGGRIVPISYHGFAWQPNDFRELLPAERFRSDDMAHHYATPGLGISLVGVRVAPCDNETFFRPRQPFGVTAVLRPCDSAAGAVLELYNPHVYESMAWNAGTMPLCAT